MPRNGTLACVFAHPDDDAYGAAGSVALHANEPDFRFVLVHATSGENGENGEIRAPPSTLGAVRRAEDEAAWREVGRVPDGIFGHPDHIAIGAATDEAFAQLRAKGGSGFQRLAHGAVPQSVCERWNRQRAELGLDTFDPLRTYHMRGVPDERIGITVDCRAVTGRIVAGLRQHVSQLHVMSDDPTNSEQWERRVRREWYSIAWPEHGEAMLTDLFDGVV